jgi:hypothetical protein
MKLLEFEKVLGKLDGQYTLCGTVELDGGLLSTEIEERRKDEILNAGAGDKGISYRINNRCNSERNDVRSFNKKI